jgi:hypothetical protein
MSGEGDPSEGWYCRDCGARYDTRVVPCEQCGGYEIDPVGGSPGANGPEATAASADDHPEHVDTAAGRTRRGWLKRVGVGAGTLALGSAGLFALGGRQPTHQAADDAWASVDEDRGRYRQQVTGTVTLPPGTYTSYSVSPSNQETTVEVHADVSEGVLDVWTISAAEFDAYESQDQYHFRNGLSDSGLTGSSSLVSQLPEQQYHIVFDNTVATGAEPDGEVTADVELVLRVLSAGWFDFRTALEDTGIEYEQLYPTENRAQWILLYEQDGDDYGPVREILRLYADHVPGDEYPHRQLVLRLSSSGAAPTTLTVSARLARRYKRGEITEQQYFEEIVN